MPVTKTKIKKDGRQQYRVRINYVDKAGKYKQVERIAYGANEAKMLELKLKQQYLDAPAESEGAGLTIEQLIERYTAAVKNDVRQSSLDKKLRIMRLHVLPLVGSIKLSNFNAAMADEWKSKINALDLSTRSKNNVYSEFNTVLNYAIRIELISKNPLKQVGKFRDASFTMPSDRLHYYTSEQFCEYIGKAKESAEHSKAEKEWGFYVFFCIAYLCGMRKGEINALKWTDIDGNIIHIHRSVCQKVKGSAVTETPPKNKASYRDIQMPTKLVSILAEHRERQRNMPGYSEDWRVCGGEACLSDTSIENHNKAYAEAANLPHIRVHDFRHSHASLLINEGINIQEIARRLGHSDIKMTLQTYAHLYPREDERSMKVLNKITF